MRAVRPATVAIVAGVTILVVAVALAAYAITFHVRSSSSATPRPITSTVSAGALGSATRPAPSASTSTPPPPTPAYVSSAVAAALQAPALGRHVLAEIADASSGAVLLDDGSTQLAAPASTAKIATAAAALLVHKPTDRITTTVVAGATPGEIVLVGAGDPTLSGAAAGTPPLYTNAARLSDLVTQVKSAGTAVTHVLVDDALFSGPTVSPGWLPEDVPSDYASAVTAVMADGGRDSPTAPVRSGAPDLGAGVELAAQLGLPGTAVSRGAAPAGARVLARVQSADYADLVRQMLVDSDNVIAETLARQVALAGGQPASFSGAVAAVRAVLTRAGVDIGAGMLDGSGLAAGDRLRPADIVAVLHLVATTDVLRPVVDGLPVGGWDGTLASRFSAPAAQAVAGLVRAKTGTLTGVSTLAGFVTQADGRVLSFSLVADRTGPSASDTANAEAALDDVIAGL
ncbi:MAG: D-alanyl-D-alanine carboxypeptidase/D-alanyl-D-alanine-endopeptidase [Actinobacteria bacterium]|nr:D-alanyl-D-alanine carboxypeptidase/D-alanyl-D-alanine-endopeptidase [Actinomycetota bacterium]